MWWRCTIDERRHSAAQKAALNQHTITAVFCVFVFVYIHSYILFSYSVHSFYFVVVCFVIPSFRSFVGVVVCFTFEVCVMSFTLLFFVAVHVAKRNKINHICMCACYFFHCVYTLNARFDSNANSKLLLRDVIWYKYILLVAVSHEMHLNEQVTFEC